MTFDQIWKQLRQKNPELGLDNAVVEFKAVNLRRLLKQVYEQGEASVPRQATADRDVMGAFNDIFGKTFGG